jgi:hypothetical protein
MPPKPTAAIPSVSQTCGCFNAPNSRKGPARASGTSRGTQSATSASVTSASEPTKANPVRQPNACPAQVAAGVPISVAMVKPSITRPTARARPAGPAMPAATSAATPK